MTSISLPDRSCITPALSDMCAMLHPCLFRFMKFNNNETFVLEEEGGMVDPLPQALSHYSFHITDRR